MTYPWVLLLGRATIVRLSVGPQTVGMAPEDIDSYLARVDEPKRGALEQLRRDILAVVPDAQECIS